MKTHTSLKLVCWLGAFALGSLSPLVAQETAAASPDDSAGLLGQTYTGLEFAYLDHDEADPRVQHRFGFVSSKPLERNIDAAFRYSYTRGTALGQDHYRHDAAMSFSWHMPRGVATPFVQADAGWAWLKDAGANRNSFAYLVAAGVELLSTTHTAITPFVSYRELPRIGAHAWNYGLKLGYRLNRGWSSTFAVQADDEGNVDYALGVQRRF